MAAMYARFFAAVFRPSAAARTPARAFFFSFSAARLFNSRAARRAGSVSFVLFIVLCHNPLGKVQKKARFGFHSRDLWLGQVTFPQRSHRFTFLFQFPARNGSYTRISVGESHALSHQEQCVSPPLCPSFLSPASNTLRPT